MYLSRVKIDEDDRRKIKDLSHLGAYHNWVEQSFPQEVKNGIRNRHLWRIDQLSGQKYLLVVSANQPDLNLLNKYGVDGCAQTTSYDQFLDQLSVGNRYRFRLTANPSYKIKVPGKDQGKVVPHITVEQQQQWLIDRQQQYGFEIFKDALGNFEFDVVQRDWPILYHGRRIKLSRVSFEGILQITDVKRFKQALTEGIGREKSYGMGLMTVIPMKADNK